MTVMIKVADEVGKTKGNISSYSELAKKLYGWKNKAVVDSMLYISQFALVVGYLYFMAEQIVYIADEKFHTKLSQKALIFVFMAFSIPMSWIRTYTMLSYFSIVGVLGCCIGICMLLGWCSALIADGKDHISEVKLWNTVNFFGHLGLAMFAFEGNGVVLNIRNETKNKHKYPVILISAMFFLIIVYMVNAVLCYFTFGPKVKDFVTVDLKPLDAYSISMIVLFIFNALTSYPLQVLAVFEIIEEHPFFYNEKDSKMKQLAKIYIERTIQIVAITLVCAFINNFLAFLNVLGSISSATLAFILPPIYYMRVFKG